MEFFSKEAQNSNIVTVAPILDNIQQPGRVFVGLFCQIAFVQMASEKPFNYRSGLWLLLNHIILSQTCSELRYEVSEVGNRLEKKITALVKDAKSVAGFVLSVNFESDRITSHINTAWLPRQFPNGGLPTTLPTRLF